MCETCGCATGPDRRTIEVMSGLLRENDAQADANRLRLGNHGVLAINLMSSPGAGKTSLLERTVDGLANGLRAAVIEGDLATENDANRLRRCGVVAVQINTGSACHLDAPMIAEALEELDLHALDVLFIENVGNLVCPASFDLGQHLNVALLSVPEGDDKPAKYPVMFRAADLILVTKADLLAHLPEFRLDEVQHQVRHLASAAPVMAVSARSGMAMHQWLAWLDESVAANRQRLQRGEHRRPRIQQDSAALHTTAKV